ncbi:hypothetical protein [Streptomyces violascens]|uniref:hypothetical protein n=1 Tax=Streptomyces violascens TaxID=67381 RepID=UPI0036A360AA
MRRAVSPPGAAGAPAATADRARAAGPRAGGGAFATSPSGMISSTPPISTAAAVATRPARFRARGTLDGGEVRWAAAEAASQAARRAASASCSVFAISMALTVRQ